MELPWYVAMAIVLGIFMIGDICGLSTGAKLSSVFVIFMIFLAGFVSGVLPKDIIAQARLTQVGQICMAFMTFNMGTSMNVKQLVKE